MKWMDLPRAGRAARMKMRVPPIPQYGHTVRDEVAAFVDSWNLDESKRDEFILAVGEAIANAIAHSRTRCPIEVQAAVKDGKLLVTVVDAGRGFRTDPVPDVAPPDAFSEHGRGLPIMRHFTDLFAVHSVPGKGTAVVLGRNLPHAA